jgi:hypothetical protein
MEKNRLILRGFSRIKNLIITRGLGGVGVIPPKPVTKAGGVSFRRPWERKYVTFKFKVLGVKSGVLKKNYITLGKVSRSLNFVNNIFGIKMYAINNSYIIMAKVSRDLNIAKSLVGTKQFDFIKNIFTKGSILNKEKNKFLVKGLKAFEAKTVINASAIKAFNSKENIYLKGIKEYSLNSELHIIGKRGITPILLALDMIGEEIDEGE